MATNTTTLETMAGTGSAMHLSHWGAYRVFAEDGRIARVEPFEHDPDPSPLLRSVAGAVHHPCRIDRPMIRRGWLEKGHRSDGAARGAEPFVAVSWARALDLLAAELDRVRTTHGNQAVYGASGWGSAGNFHRARHQLTRFLNGYGGFVNQVGNYSFGAAAVIVPRVVGSMDPVARLSTWPGIARHSRLIVSFGGLSPKNSQVAMGGLGTHDTQGMLREARRNGARFVHISPIADDVADALEAEWLALRPNTDVAVMLGLAHTLVCEGLHDEAFLGRYTTGFERFRAYLMGDSDGVAKDADWAAAISQIPADTIRALARDMAAERSLIAVSWSVQRSDHGEQPCWMAITLAAMLGQIGLPGGGIGIGYGSEATLGNASPPVPMPGISLGRNPVADYVPVTRVVDMLLNPGGAYDYNGERRTYPDIRLFYWAGGNPFHKQQDLNRYLRAWAKPETVVVHEPWWTPAAKRADVVLPVTTTLERNDIGASPRDRYFIAMQQAIPPLGEARSDYDIFTELARRLGFEDDFTEGRDEMEWLRHMYDVSRQGAARKGTEMPSFDEFWRQGHVEFPSANAETVMMAAYREDPAANALKTPSGRIEIFSDTIEGFGYDDCPGHPTWLEPVEWLGAQAAGRFPLHMVSNQPRHRMHSQMDCGEFSLDSKVAGREAVAIHPDDAASRGIADGDVVRLFNDRGACLAGAVVTDQIRPGVVRLPTGAWFDPVDAATPSSLDKHGNPNMLTIDKGTSSLAQACIAQSALVEVERYDGDPPPVTAFDPPEIVPESA